MADLIKTVVRHARSQVGFVYIMDISFHGIDTSRKFEKCYLCLRHEVSPISQVGHSFYNFEVKAFFASEKSVPLFPESWTNDWANASGRFVGH
ncbi:hypothetical protein LP7551_01464 [Roseibium album]|nr:hypothetical protein LP7551_01464 [Roseibium album]